MFKDLWDDIDPCPIALGGGTVASGFARDGLELIPKILMAYNYPKKIRIVGHSKGGSEALISAALIPDNVDLTVVAFGPPKCATRSFYTETFIKKNRTPLVIGNNHDFAINYPLLNLTFSQVRPLMRLLNNVFMIIDEFPVFIEALSDHDIVTGYGRAFERILHQG
jgi:Lipase (class 3)